MQAVVGHVTSSTEGSMRPRPARGSSGGRSRHERQLGQRPGPACCCSCLGPPSYAEGVRGAPGSEDVGRRPASGQGLPC